MVVLGAENNMQYATEYGIFSRKKYIKFLQSGYSVILSDIVYSLH